MLAVRDLTALSLNQLSALDIETPPQLSEASIPLWRSSPKAKYHWADKRASCQYLPGYYRWGAGRDSNPPLSERIPALGFAVDESALCSHCAAQIAISSPADSFIAVAAELARAAEWIQAGRAAAANGDWTWLQFARWRAREPLWGGHWLDVVHSIHGPGWSRHAAALRERIAAV
jgi:hypothetical protein